MTSVSPCHPSPSLCCNCRKWPNNNIIPNSAQSIGPQCKNSPLFLLGQYIPSKDSTTMCSCEKQRWDRFGKPMKDFTWGHHRFRDVCQKKNGKMWKFFSSPRPPPPHTLPLPLVWEPHVCDFFLHFRTFETFLVFTKMLLSGWYYG